MRDKYDSFDVYVNGELILRAGNDEWEKAKCDSPHWDSGWRQVIHPLDKYRGEFVEISFQNVIRYDWWHNTYTYVDNVQITCDGNTKPAGEYRLGALAAPPSGPSPAAARTGVDEACPVDESAATAAPCETPCVYDAVTPEECKETHPRHAR